MAEVSKKVTKKNTNKIKGKKSVSKKPVVITSQGIEPLYEYKMSKECAYATTHDVDGKVVKEAKGRITDYLVDFVNEQYGLRGTCIRVIVG